MLAAAVRSEAKNCAAAIPRTRRRLGAPKCSLAASLRYALMDSMVYRPAVKTSCHVSDP